MAWADYGFTGFDMALTSVDFTLQGMFLALKERLDAAGIVNSHYNNFSNGHYMFWPDSDGSRTASQANRYNGVESMIGSVFNGHFIDSKLSNYFNFSYDSGYRDTVLDNACDYLNNSGFQTTKIPLFQDWKLTQYNKHWLIQRKIMLDMMRYWLVELTETWTGGGSKILMEWQDTPRSGTGYAYQDTLQDVFNNLGSPKIALAPWSSTNILPLFYLNKEYRYDVSKYGYYCQAILNNLYIEKTFFDNLVSSYNDSDIRLKIVSNSYDNLNIFNGRFLLQNAILDNTYNFTNYGTFYKINFPYSTNELIDIILDNESYFDTHGEMYEQMAADTHFYQVKDGVDSFQFLDSIA